MGLNLTLILIGAFIATASPGPATLALAGTSMASGRRAGLVLASGITCGSLVWSISSALGLGAAMMANVWLFQTIRYLGAAYLLFLAFTSARAAFSSRPAKVRVVRGSYRRIFLNGLTLHLTNPKAILFFGALYSMGIPSGASALQLALVVGAVGLQSSIIFHGYAALFSIGAVNRGYIRFRRSFEGAFSVAFAFAGLGVLRSRNLDI